MTSRTLFWYSSSVAALNILKASGASDLWARVYRPAVIVANDVLTFLSTSRFRGHWPRYVDVDSIQVRSCTISPLVREVY